MYLIHNTIKMRAMNPLLMSPPWVISIDEQVGILTIIYVNSKLNSWLYPRFEITPQSRLTLIPNRDDITPAHRW
jgi:hypothetical protein